MNNKHMQFCYMPILKWKQGEQIMLRHVEPNDLSKMLPLIELLPFKEVTKDFRGNHQLSVTDTAAKLLKAKFDQNDVAIDTLHMAPTFSSQIKLLIATSILLLNKGIRVIPVVHPGMVLSEPLEFSRLAPFDQIVLRIRSGIFLNSQIPNLLNTLRAALGKKQTKIHVLFDMFDMVGTSPAAEAAAIAPYITSALSSSEVASVTVAGGAFPMSLQGIPQGTSSIPRTDFLTYALLQSGNFAQIAFGDYTVSNPIPLEGLDPTKMNPSAQIRYTRLTDWMLLKAGGSKTFGMGQYNALAKILVSHKDYSGKIFSFGDERYDYHAQTGSSSGSYMTWRRDATSHHVIFTLRQLRAVHGV